MVIIKATRITLITTTTTTIIIIIKELNKII